MNKSVTGSKLGFMQQAVGNTHARKVYAAVESALSDAALLSTLQKGNKTFAKERLGTDDEQTVKSAADALQSAIERQVQISDLDAGFFTAAGMKAAREMAVIASGDVSSIARAPIEYKAVGVENFTGVDGVADAHELRLAAREAYDERDNTNALKNSVTYSLLSGNQAPAAELFYPTVSIPHDQMGISVTLRIHEVLKDKKRDVNGKVTNFERRNLIDAMIDDTILRNDSTLAVPVHSAGTAEFFMPGVTPANITAEGVTTLTAPLAFGKTLDLLPLSANQALIANGLMDITDSLDTDVQIGAVYLKVGGDIIKIRTDAIAQNNFVWTGQGNYREQKLHMRTTSLYLSKESRTFGGGELAEAGLAGIKDGTFIVRLSGVFTGQVNINEGQLTVDVPGPVKVEAVIDAATKTDVTNSTGAALKTAIEAGTYGGYDVLARRANSNLRERGDIIDTQYYTQIWAVPLRSPICALRPVNASSTQDADDIEKLASTSYARKSGAAYRHILDTIDQLRHLKGQAYDTGVKPESLGVGRHLLNTLLIEEDVDFATNLQNLSSEDLAANISAMLVNRMRDAFYRLYRDTKMQAVVESGAAGTKEQPTALVMCDPLVGRYMMVEGDTRTLGPDFKMVVKTTPNKRIENKIIMAFGYPNQTNANEVNALHFGAMLDSTELVLVLPISRGGQTSKELTVQPRFRHICNVPALVLLNVKNLSEVVKERIPVDFNQL